ncbi:dihydroneopterin aldolase [candidate division KSB1 bacterium]|nr:dihydroneopterin aldolase [candidate division KSB1 bacterium]
MSQKKETNDYIHIKGLCVNCITGFFPEELQRKQPLIIDLRLGLNLSFAGRSGRILDTCDYDRVTDEVIALMKFRKYRLLENAAEEIAAMLFGIHKNIVNLHIRIKKPRALKGRAHYAAIEISRTREDFPNKFEKSAFGETEILLKTRLAGLYLFHIDAGMEILLHYHKKIREIKWLVTGNVLFNDNPITAFTHNIWSKGQYNSYRNIGNESATIFFCYTPPFFPEHKVIVKRTRTNELASSQS